MRVQLTIIIMSANVLELVVPPLLDRNPAYQALAWIGFVTEGNRKGISNESGLEAFENSVGLTVSNIRDMAAGFSKRITAQGRINFGMRRVKYALCIMNWAQSESPCSCTESLTGIADTREYKALLVIALYRATLRKVGAYQADTIRKAADPGKFKDDSTWTEWEVKFENYLSTIPGVNSVPLSYVLRSH